MEIRLLTEKEKTGLCEVFFNEFDSSPVPEYVVGILDANGDVESFLVVENLIRVGLLWSKDELRNTARASTNSRALARYVYRAIPPGKSAIVIASDARFEPFLKKLGMREVEGKVFRKDF